MMGELVQAKQTHYLEHALIASFLIQVYQVCFQEAVIISLGECC
jgi:hypothetical protein